MFITTVESEQSFSEPELRYKSDYAIMWLYTLCKPHKNGTQVISESNDLKCS